MGNLWAPGCPEIVRGMPNAADTFWVPANVWGTEKKVVRGTWFTVSRYITENSKKINFFKRSKSFRVSPSILVNVLHRLSGDFKRGFFAHCQMIIGWEKIGILFKRATSVPPSNHNPLREMGRETWIICTCAWKVQHRTNHLWQLPTFTWSFLMRVRISLWSASPLQGAKQQWSPSSPF